MVQQLSKPDSVINSAIIYPDSDGQPMSDNTLQFQWIVTIKENLELVFAQNPDVFIAGDLLWYPVEGNNKIRRAPDAMVVFGRQKGYRGSYRQWEEANIPPQVVFEILSPGNTLREMATKLEFYRTYGVEEYYLYDPDNLDFTGWQKVDQELTVIEEINGWVSPHLGIRFEIDDGELLRIFTPDNQLFLTFVELAQARESDQKARIQAEQKMEIMAAKLRELGIDPDTL